MKIKMTVEVEIEDGWFDDNEDGRMWMENEVLVGDGNLIIHSNDVGDTVGVIKSVRNIIWVY